MSFFNKMLASVGIGAARIDTRLDKNSYQQGEEVTGTVLIKGGNVEQAVDRIYIKVMTEYIKEQDDKRMRHSYTLDKFVVSERLVVKPGQELDIPFSFNLPLDTPLSFSGQPVWLKTGLDIENAMDPKDEDYIEVTPHPDFAVVLDAVRQLGFRFKSASCEYHPRLGKGLPFIQEIEFYPGGEFSRSLTELELVLYHESDGVSVLVEVDRRGSGLSGWLERSFDMDERHSWLSMDNDQLRRGPSYAAGLLEDIIRRQIH